MATNGATEWQRPAVNGRAYPIEDHTFDVVVVGAGGSGLRAVVGCSEAGLQDRLHHQGVPDPLAHRRGAGRHLRRARQHGRGRLALAHVRHRQGLRLARRPGRHRISVPQRARRRSTSSSIGACRSRAREDGKIYQRPFGGMTTHYGKGTAQRTCAAADRTGHAMLHTMYGQSLRHAAEFFIEYFAIDLIMDDEGRCRGVIALKLDDGTIHRFRAHMTILATGGYGRAYFSCTSAPHLHRRRQRHGAARRPAAAGHGVRAVPSDRHLRRRLPDHRGRARRRRLSGQFRGRALHGALRAVRQGPRLARRGLARHDDRDPRRPRRRQEQGPHLPAPRPSRPGGAARAAARHLRNRAHLRRRRRHRASRSRCCRPCTTTWAASPRTITARC